MNGERRLDPGAIVFGLILLAVGAYYLLRNTLGIDIPEIKGDQVWPLLIVGLGVVVLYRAWDRGRSPR